MRTMMFTAAIAATVVCTALVVQASEKKVAMKDVPAAVQQAIKDQSKGATVKGVTTEVENGKTVYEAELKVNGHSKDITFDAQGQIVSVEEETPLQQIPGPAREAIQKAAGTGKVLEVETVKEGGKTFYEAQIKTGAKKSEVKVDATGQVIK
jgi:uncharacterized membrane protein YkoI